MWPHSVVQLVGVVLPALAELGGCVVVAGQLYLLVLEFQLKFMSLLTTVDPLLTETKVGGETNILSNLNIV